jgi:hypothetical protein
MRVRLLLGVVTLACMTMLAEYLLNSRHTVEAASSAEAIIPFEQKNISYPNLSSNKKRIITFSLFHHNSQRFLQYYGGLVQNVRAVYELLPGWSVRVYYEQSLEPFIDIIRKLGVETIAMQIQPEFSERARLWRFLAADDDAVEAFLSRDSDSRITQREVILIEEWIRSNRSVHCIRDHERHFGPILGGMWGAYTAPFRRMINGSLYEKLSYLNFSENPNADELFLQLSVWPSIINDVLVHDSFIALHQYCLNYSHTCVPFPQSAREFTHGYVGQQHSPSTYIYCTSDRCWQMQVPWRESARIVLSFKP